MQIFPSPTASEGPTLDKRAQPLSAEKRADAADSAGPHAGSAPCARAGTRSGMSNKLTRSIAPFLLLSTHLHTFFYHDCNIWILSVFSRGLLLDYFFW